MKYLVITQRDGSLWKVPVDLIARSRATHYAPEFGGDVERSLKEDTMPLFEDDDYEIQDWAANNMNWDEVAPKAAQLRGPLPLSLDDFQEAWTNGSKEVMEEPE